MSLTYQVCRVIDRLFSTLSTALGNSIAWLTILMAFTTAAVVLIRSIFSTNSVALQESVTYMHALVLMCGNAYTLYHNGHVRVDILYRRFSVEQQAWVNALGTLLLLLPFCFLTIVTSWQFVLNAWNIREGSPDAGGIQGVYLLKTLILVNGVLLALQGLAELARQVITVTYSDEALSQLETGNALTPPAETITQLPSPGSQSDLPDASKPAQLFAPQKP